ncbi:ATPase [Marinobacterium sedimentorum]|uniref:ATPase n=1 Tax=Marinobacterium sedimentorum TaxID=2927804 RepID=UPI0020C60133|nr:ATPase [Marinobacterium sedimentorum]MCP8689342.1 ATPase [Marinobacterium sedimentorum]
MQIETLKDVLHWTAELHRQLSGCLKHCEDRVVSERAQLLLDYLEQHEDRLAQVIDRFEEMASSQALNTWCYEYFDKNPAQATMLCDGELDTQDIAVLMARILEQHNLAIELYRYLFAQSSGGSARELLQNLIDIETHAAMQMSQGGNRLGGI